MGWNYSNTATTTSLPSGINNVTTSVAVASVSGFPVSFPYTVVIDPDEASREVVNVTSAVGTTLTVVRGQDGTSATTHSAGAVVIHAIVARDVAEPQAHIDATSDIHGIGGSSDLVGTNTSQTLTNKTLTSPIITGATLGVSDVNFSITDDGDATKIAKFQASGITTGTTRTLTVPDASGTLVLADATQTLTGKTITVADSAFTLQDNGDTSKQLQLQLSGITTGTTRTLTVPDVTDTIVTLAATQTLTNKTLTSPTITTPTISSPTFSGTSHVLFKYKASNEDVTSSTVLQDDNDLTGTVETGVYKFEAFLIAQHVASAAGINIKIKWSAPASTTMKWHGYSHDPSDDVLYSVADDVMSDATEDNFDLGATNNIIPIYIKGICIFTNTGTFKLTWAQQTSDGNAIRLHLGSWFELVKRSA